MSEKIILTGVVLILIGVILLIVGNLINLGKASTRTDFAVGGFIGPFPFGFFTSKSMFWIWFVIMIAFLVLWFLIRRIL